jgi:Lipocalin-like domain
VSASDWMSAMRDAWELVGTWRMLSWRREFADTGEQIDALGANPVGFVSYSADGRVNAIVLRRDLLRPAFPHLRPTKLNCSTRC